ncbi:MAG: AraC family transcriptional regulator [Rhodospirillaceae bacterium]|nr:AraC family transcriptional regulator [Rhodospirillaceae bacterium]
MNDVSAIARSPYHARFQRVLDYIEAHTEGDLSAEALSAVAAFSRFHFHRQFAAQFGVSAHRYVHLVRLKRAGYQLAYRDQLSVLEIALGAGYEGPEAFARTFKQLTGQTPSDFRSQPQWHTWQNILQPLADIKATHMKQHWQPDQVKIVEVPATRLAVMEHRGDPTQIGNTIRAFIAWRKSVGLSPKVSATYNILYDDPTATPPDQFKLDLGVATARDITAQDVGLVMKTIPAGRCAVLRHVGSEATFGDAVMYLYAQWLPQSGADARDFPLYCQRVAFYPDVPEHQAVTDIYLPLQ